MDSEQWEYTQAVCKPRRTAFGVGGYEAWYVDLVDDEPVKGKESMTAYTNRLGADGWELCSTVATPGNSVILFFRRLVIGE